MEEEKTESKKMPKSSNSRKAVIAIIVAAAVIIAFALLIRAVVKGTSSDTGLTEGSVVVQYTDENGETVTGILNVDSDIMTTVVEYTDANGEKQTNRGYIIHLNTEEDQTIIVEDTTTTSAE